MSGEAALLAAKTVVCIGTGGARSWLEDLARAGVGRFILIDGDRVETANVATQGVCAREAGRYKVDCIRRSIRRIRPGTRVAAVRRFLDDGMEDGFLETLLGRAALERPEDILLAGCTDAFPAQARSARLALKLGTPYLAAQLYRGGLAGEIYFSYPGVTTGGCPRCALESRYRAYRRGFENDVTSEGASIFATQRLNALKGQIALMLLLYRSGDGPYARLLEQVKDRNFVLIRMYPGAGALLDMPILDRCGAGELSCFDEALWIPQHPNSPRYGEEACPLCGGAEDLSALAGRFADTRIGE